MTGMISLSSRSFRNQSASKALSASKCPYFRRYATTRTSPSRLIWLCQTACRAMDGLAKSSLYAT